MKTKAIHWRKFNGQPLQNAIVEEVRQTIQKEQEAGHRIKVCIGSDSQVKGSTIEFATAIVFIREKKGGFMYLANEKVKQTMTIKERMIAEVAKSIDIAYRLCDTLDAYGVALEVHADINTDPQFQSNSALKEAMGYILGMGFIFKAKPDAFASSSCADKVI